MSQIFFNTINNDQYDFMTEWNTTVMDKWVAENIGLSRCKDEAELFETKWFDYRDMHPLMATCLFTEAYKRQYSYIMLSHDLVITINKTEEEEAKGEARLYFAGSRNQKGGVSIRVKQNLEQMRFIERIMDVL